MDEYENDMKRYYSSGGGGSGSTSSSIEREREYRYELYENCAVVVSMKFAGDSRNVCVVILLLVWLCVI